MCVSVSLCVRVYNRCVYCPLLLLLQLLLCCCCSSSAASSRRQRCCCSYVFLRLHTNILLPGSQCSTHTQQTHTHAAPKLHSLSPRSCPLASLASPLTSMISVVAAQQEQQQTTTETQTTATATSTQMVFSCSAAKCNAGGKGAAVQTGQVAQQLQQRHLTTELQDEPGKQL